VTGYKIPDISNRIIEYKKRKKNFETNESKELSNILKLLICLFNFAAWIATGLYTDNIVTAVLIGIQITLGLIIAVIDINIRIIPNELVLTLIILGITFQTINFGFKNILGAIISMIAVMIIFTAVAGFMGFGKVGAGDVKLAGAIALALGYPLIITAVGIMAIVLLTYILIGLALKKIYLSTMLPLAPFLSAGYILALLTIVLNVGFI
jgi:leader peptidase (prepilin peptidase)/N-methyltransferase